MLFFIFLVHNVNRIVNERKALSIIGNNNNDKIYSTRNTLRITKDIDVYSKEATAIVVTKVLKGDVKIDSEIKILQWDGELDGQVQTAEGAIKYVEGQKNLLFLGTDEIGNWGVFAGDWGQYPIDENNMVKDFNDKTVSFADFENAILEPIK